LKDTNKKEKRMKNKGGREREGKKRRRER